MARADEHSIKNYLLGRLTEAEEEQVELRLLTDAEFAEEYDIVVNEITDDYVAGKFEGDDHKQVERYFFKSPARTEKLKFALALKEHGKRQGTKKPARKNSFTRYFFIAATIAVFVGAGVGIWRILFQPTELDRGLIALRAAFKDERPLEARLSDFNYAPVANQRGGPARVDYVQRDLAASLLLKGVSERPSADAHHALGQYYLAERQFDKAIDQFQAALALNPNYARAHNDFGAALLELGIIQRSGKEKGKELETFARSLEHLEKALELDSTLLEARFNRALVSQNMMPSQQAEEAWREYLQKDSNSPWADEARRRLKLLEENKSRTSWNTQQALKEFQEARRAGDDDGAWYVLSQAYTSGGNEITNSLLNSLFGVDAAGESTEPVALDGLADVARLESDRAGDRFTSDLVKQYDRTPPKLPPMKQARERMRRAYALFSRSKFSDAVREYSSAKSAYEQAGDRISTAFVDYRQAHCYVLIPDLDKAEDSFKHLLPIYEKGGYRWLAAQSLYGLAHVNAARNEYSKALDYSSQALTLFEQIGDRNGILKCMAQLADLNQSLNRADRSLGYLSRGLAYASEIRAEPMQRWGLFIQIAFSMKSIQMHAAALLYHKAALAIALEMDRPLIISRSHSYVGSAYATLKMYPEAVNEANKAIEIGRSIRETDGLEIMANGSLQLGDIQSQAGACDEAIKAYDRGIELYEDLREEYYSLTAHKGKLLCLIAGSDNETVRNELRIVMDLFESYRSRIETESERVSFFELQQSVYDLAINFEFVRMENQARAFDHSEKSKARALLDVIRRRAEVSKRIYGPDLKLPKEVTTPLSSTQIQAKMPADTQILQYAVLDDKLVMWIVTKLEIRHKEVAITFEVLTQKVRDYLTRISIPPADNASGPPDQSSELYRILIAPVEPLLDKSKFLCLVPDKILHYVPYDALMSPATSRFLMEDFRIGVAPSSSLFVDLSDTLTLKVSRSEEKILSVGNPQFDHDVFGSLPDLPSAGQEARAVAAFYPRRRVLAGPNASETNIRAEIGGAEVAHLAMHYVVNEKAEMLSGFPLAGEPLTQTHENSNGFLQSYEIYTMSFPRTRLVVLSACQTGIEQEYRGEGAVSVARPFLAKGVPIVVATLWRVDSDASAKLMVNFHKYRVQHNLDVAEALKAAQTDMARGLDMRYRHPYYWAPFVVIGGQSSSWKIKKGTPNKNGTSRH